MTAAATTMQARPLGATARTWVSAALRRPALLGGAGLLLALVVFCFIGPLLRPFGPNEISGLPLAAPDAVHWLGTDDLGRDVFVRLAVGGHSSLAISFFAATLAALVGTAIGLAAGLWGRWLDAGLMVCVELVLAVPAILLALCAVTIFGGSIPAVIGVLAIAAVPEFARLVRAKCLELRELDFVLSARVSGVGASRIALRHLLPNTFSVIVVQFANTAAISILLEASLSYLGLSVQPPTPSWGRMIFDAQTYMTIAPWLAVAPLLAILALSSGWGLVGESLANRRRRVD
ncbi:ABC transporter permease [Microbacterium sp. 18062]|uniref:ABC transporter permease n=1 Tax=Microbacterium sp. 18062 TaxID=2681410 RepID=UPI00135B0589|nr:ABC transporter permease [Microbacterium sp. 18062]